MSSNQNQSYSYLPGDSGKRIPTVTSQPDHDVAHVRSPEWMIQMDDVLTSNVEGFNDYCELFGWYSEFGRNSTGDIGNSLFTSASLRHSELIVLIPNGGFTTVLENRANNGTPIEALTIVRLGYVKGEKVKLQEVVYTICRIISIQQDLDRIYLKLNVVTRKNTIFVYDMDGAAQGQTVSEVDYSKNLITA
jgi:hypothetical protein